MGLDCSRDAFSGGYMSFNLFRRAVAKAMGGSFPPHDKGLVDDDGQPLKPDQWYRDSAYGPLSHPGLNEFMSHSDCDGEIATHMCAKLATEMEALLPQLDAMGAGAGHVLRDGGYGAVARRFIAGCRAAVEAMEPLLFH